MRRREFIALVGRTAVAWPLAARAQQSTPPLIGFMSSRSPEDSQSVLAALQGGNRTRADPREQFSGSRPPKNCPNSPAFLPAAIRCRPCCRMRASPR